MKLYRVVTDYQGGTFAMGIAQSAEHWLDTMLEWRESDGSFGDWGDEEKDTREYQDRYWRGEIAKGNEQDLIDYIADLWDLEFQTIGEDLQKQYQTYLSEFDRAEGEPVCFCEWLDNEAEQLGTPNSRNNREGAEYFGNLTNEDKSIIY